MLKIKLICEQCKKEFDRYPSQISRFCSMKCYREWLPPRRVVICEQCGNEFTCKSCEIDRRFCCEKCYGLYREKTYSGENNPLYGRHYDEDHCESISKGLKNSIKHKEISEIYRGGTDIVRHHYIYDFDDMDKYTIEVTRSEHRGIHNKLRAAGLDVPCINIFKEEDDKMNLIKITKKDDKDIEPSIRKVVKNNTHKGEILNGHVSAVHL